jgi:XTP/dITP diphosphohydrolase
MKTLVIATRNAHKLEEIRRILAETDVRVLDLSAYPDAPEVEEDQPTFEGNAIKKAASLAGLSGEWALADDSGLEVDALDGAPGVYSARYAGEPVDYAANNAKLLRELAGAACRTARFRCVIALVSPGGEARTVSGACEGIITDSPRGASGFGYDPVFAPEGESRTFAEMSAAEKDALSHRGVALAAARRELLPWLEACG